VTTTVATDAAADERSMGLARLAMGRVAPAG
jgi:hypothetical protein